MNEWASKILSVFPDRSKADLDQFIIELNNDQAEQMYYQKEIDEETECRPSFEQLSVDRINEEANRNLSSLKALETLIQDRFTAFNAFQNNISKIRSLLEAFQQNEGSLKVSVDSFCIFVEQEVQKSKQQIYLSDLKRSLAEMRMDAQRRVNEYLREIQTAEKDLASAEKKIQKSKEALDRASTNRLESFELDSLINGNPKHKHNSSSFGNAQDLKTSSKDKEKNMEHENRQKYEKELRDDINTLLKAIAHRDQVLSATRRAFQKLDRECKRAIHYTLKKVLDKELDSLEAQKAAIENFSRAVEVVNVEEDVDSFIQNFNHEEGALVLSSQALNLLGDLIPEIVLAESRNSTASPVTTSPQSPLETPAAVIVEPVAATAQSKLHRKFTFKKKSISTSSPPPNPSLLASSSSSPTPSVSNSSRDRESSATSPIDITKVAAGSQQSVSNPGSEYATHLSIIFGDDTTNDEETISSIVSANNLQQIFSNSNEDSNRGDRATHTNITIFDIKTLAVDELNQIGSNNKLSSAVTWLCNSVKTAKGREYFTTELNQFRSRKVELCYGFSSLAMVLWFTLSVCQKENDVHTAKIIMMLSQTFYRMRPSEEREQLYGVGVRHCLNTCMDSMNVDEVDEEVESAKRGVLFRQFIKEKLMGHAIWQDGNFWEQALWQCAIEQLKTIPYEKPWYEMDRECRDLSVRRVHDVVFSQVMAITHSMLELGCPRLQCREFLYRMCVIHQLTESQRQQLLSHVLNRPPSGI